jgi:hypothetical protein
MMWLFNTNLKSILSFVHSSVFAEPYRVDAGPDPAVREAKRGDIGSYHLAFFNPKIQNVHFDAITSPAREMMRPRLCNTATVVHSISLFELCTVFKI